MFGVVSNLALLCYYKYANFFVDNLNILAGTSVQLETIVLPLAISFFTFQQIAYLVDTWRGYTREYGFLHYALFVTFFPQLVAGPIVHHKEMLPQFLRDTLYRLRSINLAVGITIFTIGLFKKAVIADGIALYANPVFDASAAGAPLTLFEAWGGALSYTFQIYFDFSGYSDMAIGVARMFGVRLPLNFNSPYKATSIVHFWRRWHITLSRFLRDYVYISLGGNRKGELRRLVNLFITMLLGGIWHGAGWTFVLWGGLHGIYLIINHGWYRLMRILWPHHHRHLFIRLVAWLVTFIAVVFAWVPFRSTSLQATWEMWQGMVGINGVALPENTLDLLNRLGGYGDRLANWGWQFSQVEHLRDNEMPIYLALVAAVAFLPPNTQQIMRRYRPAFETYRGEVKPIRWRWVEWRPDLVWIIIISMAAAASLFLLDKKSEFLYFNF